jgi:hypothetical protein
VVSESIPLKCRLGVAPNQSFSQRPPYEIICHTTVLREIIKQQTMAVEGPTHLGSASWIGVDEYDPGDRFYERATKFFAAVKWDVLASVSSDLRNSVPCQFSEKYSIGHFNMVRRIVFADGVSWVARLRLPQLEAIFGDRELLDVARTIKVEVASMNFLRYVMSGNSQVSC